MSYRRGSGDSVRRRRKVYRKRGRNRQGVNLKKLSVIALGVLAASIVGYVVYLNLPFVKVNKAIAAGDKYSENADYEAAINSYKEAIEIDKHSVKAYSNMAGAYLSINDTQSAKQVLYDGWQNTGNEGLLSNYHAVILNEAVSKMNAQSTDLDTLAAIIGVLEENNGNTDAVQLLDAAYTRVFSDSYSYDVNALFRPEYVTHQSEGNNATASFAGYVDIMNRLISVYNTQPSDDLKSAIAEYVIPGSSSFTMNMQDINTYLDLINKVTSITGSNEQIDSFKACLTNAQEVESAFEDIFTQLDVGNVDELRDFVVSDKYLSIRDIFLNNQETPQENTVYVPISREAIILNNKDGKWSYRFLDFSENPTTAGVITVWGNYFEDDGVQRNSISYEPASIEDNYYPHTKYSVTYLYSYTTSGKSTKVPKLNYRLDTTIEYQDGTVDETIVGDWGGDGEWIMDIDTIESRIRA